MNPNHLVVQVEVRLAALWASTMFLYVEVDIVSLYKPGTVRDILRGRVWEFEITQGWALGALALMTIPSVMIALSVLLPTRANQRTNIVVASLFILVSIGKAIGETWAFIWFGAIVEVVLLATIVRLAWRCARSRGNRYGIIGGDGPFIRSGFSFITIGAMTAATRPTRTNTLATTRTTRRELARKTTTPTRTTPRSISVLTHHGHHQSSRIMAIT
jgi:hypothetical protein